jgi:26S proteasome regulatory subunit N2
MKAQLKVMSMPTGSRYIPLKDISHGGIIMMKNARPAEQEEIIELVAAGGPKGEEEGAEPEPPEPFEWTDE